MARRWIMLCALAAVLALAPALAEARAGKGGSIGSRGTRTYQAPPPTQTAPTPKPVERSVTQPAAPNQQAAPAPQQPRPAAPLGGMSPFATGLLGGLLGAGLVGLLMGHGFNLGALDLAGAFGLMLQAALIGGAFWLLLSFFRRRQMAPAMARAAQPAHAPMPAGPAPDIRGLDLGGVRQDERAASPAAEDSVGLRKSDFDDFERALKDTQGAFSRADMAALGRLCTPEMLAYLSEQLTDDASAGLSNRVEQVSLEQGDLAEAWREGGRDYATVAMRWRALDYTVEVESGRIVSGNTDTPVEATELWTFLRGPSGRWLVSAIQQG